ncbi:hypothetical protein GN244_ATG16440 [Phytophthora infestans]|uniref:Secreted RxLR effector peptide protein n=1 Tax=Phytophthora infestans TaxID=4787 RepID=A0A833WME8_PHYIN|nr:hypothetical protein GN244_ATG16440 [Phytophthora infestans]KAF4132298.1 hypothetical protein GN958_ATG18415 [Phytophthora infestans]
MAFPSFLKIIALIALFTLTVNADDTRRLRSGYDVVNAPVARELQGKNPATWFKIIKKDVVGQPIFDKVKEKYQQASAIVKGKGK